MRSCGLWRRARLPRSGAAHRATPGSGQRQRAAGSARGRSSEHVDVGAWHVCLVSVSGVCCVEVTGDTDRTGQSAVTGSPVALVVVRVSLWSVVLVACGCACWW